MHLEINEDFRDALRDLIAGRELSIEATRRAVELIVEGAVPESLVASFLTALRIRGETIDEMTGAALAVRAAATPFFADDDRTSFRPGLLDTCGTGGDGAKTVNISTATAIVAAAAGAKVAKHGNRSASGNSGSAEVLEKMNVAIDIPAESAALSLDLLGITFLFAVKYHPALRRVAPMRKQLPFRTIFNLVGPLCNPASPSYQLIGVPNESHLDIIAGAVARLGTVDRAAIVWGTDGVDEVSLAAPTRVRLIENRTIRSETWTPDDFGLERVDANDLVVADPAASARMISSILAGESIAARQVVLANCAAALVVAGEASSFRDGVSRAEEAIDSGAAKRLLERWSLLTRSAPPPLA